MTLFKGQSVELKWSLNMVCPSFQEYDDMINDSESELSFVVFTLP